jgi:hypothetical protein
MNRRRLLLALPAATALVLAGGSPALAGGDGHSDDDTWAKVIEINDEAELEDDGDVLQVTFEYKCEDDDDDDKVTADVKAEDGDISYEADDVELDCNGEKNEITVALEVVEDYEKAEEGDKVDVTVTITEDDEKLDEETKEDVEVVDKDNGDKDNGDKDNGDKDNGDKHEHDHGDKHEHDHGDKHDHGGH